MKHSLHLTDLSCHHETWLHLDFVDWNWSQPRFDESDQRVQLKERTTPYQYGSRRRGGEGLGGCVGDITHQKLTFHPQLTHHTHFHSNLQHVSRSVCPSRHFVFVFASCLLDTQCCTDRMHIFGSRKKSTCTLPSSFAHRSKSMSEMFISVPLSWVAAQALPDVPGRAMASRERQLLCRTNTWSQLVLCHHMVCNMLRTVTRD